ncbi:unnamed protein product [Closterium sp. NIES-65]|nr:unnamed protein product [Closterium sp. NIES-65]
MDRILLGSGSGSLLQRDFARRQPILVTCELAAREIRSATMAVTEVTSAEAFEAAAKEGAPVAVHFWAAWCEPCKHMDVVFGQLAAENPHAKFLRVEAEEVPEVSEKYSVSAVPFFVFLKDGKVVDRLEGANPPELAHKVALHIAAPSSATNFSAGGSAAAEVIESVLHSARTAAYPAAAPPAASPAAAVAQPEQPSRMIAPPAGSDKPKLSPDLKARIEALLASHPVLLFMKGTPSAPRCGFSSKVVSVLEKDLGSAAAGAYGSFDILQDEEVRQGLKVYSDWPTFPQLYCKGELVGGCDIVLQMHESGELKEVFAEKGVLGGAGKGDAPGAVTAAAAAAADGQVDGAKGLQERLKALLSSSPTMLFMKMIEGTRLVFAFLSSLPLIPSSHPFLSSLPLIPSSHPFLSSLPLIPSSLLRYLSGNTGGAAVWVQPQGGGCSPGTPEEPRCGFSRKVVDALTSEGNTAGAPVWVQPQGGGCSQVRHGLIACFPPSSPLLPPLFPPSSPPLPPLFPMACPHGLALLSQGTPEEPRCGFSRKVVDALTSEGISFGSFDILTDEAVRQGLKELSNWPTYPQVYHKGELIGGCDIVFEMKANGELKAELGG